MSFSKEDVHHRILVQLEFSASCSLMAATFKRLTKDGPWRMLPKASGYAPMMWTWSTRGSLEPPTMRSIARTAQVPMQSLEPPTGHNFARTAEWQNTKLLCI